MKPMVPPSYYNDNILDKRLGLPLRDNVDSLSVEDAKFALQHFRQKLAHAIRSKDETAKAWALLGTGMVMRGQRDYRQSYTIFERAKSTFEGVNDPLGLAFACHELAYANRELDRSALALEYAHKAAAQFERMNCNAELAWTYDNLSIIHFNLFKRTESLAFAKKARSIFVELDLQSGMAWNACNLAVLYLGMGFYDQAQRYFSEAHRLFEKIGSQQGLGWSLLGLGTVLRSLCKFDESEKTILKAKAVYEKLRYEERIGWCLVNLAALRRLTGQQQDSMRINKQGMQRFSPLRNHDGVGWCMFQLGQIYRDQGQLLKSWQVLREAFNLHTDVSNRKGMGWDQNDMGKTYFLLNDIEHARECFIKVRVLAEQLGEFPLKIEVNKNLGILNFDEGYLESAMLALNECGAEAKKLQARDLEVETLLQRARFNILKDDIGRAAENAKEAKAIAKSVGLERWLPGIDICLAEIMLNRKEITLAEKLLRQVVETTRKDGFMLEKLEAQLGLVQIAIYRNSEAKVQPLLNEIMRDTRLVNSRRLKTKALALKILMDYKRTGELDSRALEQCIHVAQSAGLVLIEMEIRNFCNELLKNQKMDLEYRAGIMELKRFVEKGPADLHVIPHRREGVSVLPLSMVI